MAKAQKPADVAPEAAESAPTKACERCGEDRAPSTFARTSLSEDGRVAVCRVCTG